MKFLVKSRYFGCKQNERPAYKEREVDPKTYHRALAFACNGYPTPKPVICRVMALLVLALVLSLATTAQAAPPEGLPMTYIITPPTSPTLPTWTTPQTLTWSDDFGGYQESPDRVYALSQNPDSTWFLATPDMFFNLDSGFNLVSALDGSFQPYNGQITGFQQPQAAGQIPEPSSLLLLLLGSLALLATGSTNLRRSGPPSSPACSRSGSSTC